MCCNTLDLLNCFPWVLIHRSKHWRVQPILRNVTTQEDTFDRQQRCSLQTGSKVWHQTSWLADLRGQTGEHQSTHFPQCIALTDSGVNPRGLCRVLPQHLCYQFSSRIGTHLPTCIDHEWWSGGQVEKQKVGGGLRWAGRGSGEMVGGGGI